MVMRTPFLCLAPKGRVVQPGARASVENRRKIPACTVLDCVLVCSPLT
jgi:hypothetical protein